MWFEHSLLLLFMQLLTRLAPRMYPGVSLMTNGFLPSPCYTVVRNWDNQIPYQLRNLTNQIPYHSTAGGELAADLEYAVRKEGGPDVAPQALQVSSRCPSMPCC